MDSEYLCYITGARQLIFCSREVDGRGCKGLRGPRVHIIWSYCEDCKKADPCVELMDKWDREKK